MHLTPGTGTVSSCLHSTFSLGRPSWPSVPKVMLAAMLTVAVTFTMVKTPARAAIEAGSVTWSAGDVSWEILDDGRCLTTQVVDVSTKNTDDARALSQAMRGLPHKTDFPAQIGIQDAHANVGSPINTTDFPLVLHTYLRGDRCKAASTAQQALLHVSGGDQLDTVQLTALPTWAKIAIGAVVVAATYAGVSTLTMVGLASAGVAVTTTVAAQSMAACVAGAASSAMANQLILGWPDSWQGKLATEVGGCITGGTSGVFPPTARLAAAIGSSLRTAFGTAPTAVVGGTALAVSESAGLEMVTISQVINATAAAALAAQ